MSAIFSRPRCVESILIFQSPWIIRWNSQWSTMHMYLAAILRTSDVMLRPSFSMEIYFALIDPSSTKWLPFWQTTFWSAFSCIRCVDGCVAACTFIIMSCRSVSVLVQNCHRSNMSTIYAIQINTDAAIHRAVINGIAKTHSVSIRKVPHLTYQLHCHGELDAPRRDHRNYICASE